MGRARKSGGRGKMCWRSKKASHGRKPAMGRRRRWARREDRKGKRSAGVSGQ